MQRAFLREEENLSLEISWFLKVKPRPLSPCPVCRPRARWESLGKASPTEARTGSWMFLEKDNGAGLPLTRQTEASCVRAALVPGREMLLVTLCGN